MIKNIKELFINKAFIMIVILSFLLTAVSFISYSKETLNGRSSSIYVMQECETLEDYENAISNVEAEIEELRNGNNKYSKELIEYYEKQIILYKSLRDNGISYSECMDDVDNRVQDELSYLNYSTKIIALISSLIVISAIYVLILKDYTNSAYTIIYENDRSSIINKKVLLIYLISIISYVLFFMFNFCIAKMFDSDFKYFISFNGNEVEYTTKNAYIFIYLFLSGLLITTFTTSISLGLALLLRKFITWIIILGVIFIVLIALKTYLLDAFIYMGFTVDLYTYGTDKYFLSLLWQIIPISFLTISVINFKKADL